MSSLYCMRATYDSLITLTSAPDKIKLFKVELQQYVQHKSNTVSMNTHAPKMGAIIPHIAAQECNQPCSEMCVL